MKREESRVKREALGKLLPDASPFSVYHAKRELIGERLPDKLPDYGKDTRSHRRSRPLDR